MASRFIKIRGARVHNLKNINLDLPRNKFIVITGISGSGKSSLAFDTIYAEGQRRYVESLSSYARQFLGIMDKPEVDLIEGLSPAISVDQKSTSHNPRSTVGTVTEIYDYLRLLFARCGLPHCPKCGREITAVTIDQIVSQILNLPDKSQIVILGPVVRDRKGQHREILEKIKKQGWVKVRIDGFIFEINDALKINLEKQKKHSIEVVIDRINLYKKYLDRARLVDSIEQSLRLGEGTVKVVRGKKEMLFSEKFACEKCGISLGEIEPRCFSFNSPYGACERCMGLGTRLEVDSRRVIPNKDLTIYEGAIRPWGGISRGRYGKWHYNWYLRQLEDLASEHNFSLDVPIKELSKKQIDLILYGDENFEGVIPNLERRHKETQSDYVRREIENYMIVKACPQCQGKRLKKEFLAVTFENKSIDQICQMSIKDCLKFFEEVKPEAISRPILKEIITRLGFLVDVGLDYLTLGRGATTLAGGEAQRTRLATQIGSGLVGVTYILDEPTIGLHPRDIQRLIDTLKQLRDLGNTVIVCEHDEKTIRQADLVIDLGPRAGDDGGEIVAYGPPRQIAKTDTLTGLYLAGKKKIPLPIHYRKGIRAKLKIVGAQEHNLKNIDVEIPLAKFVCVTGVSGSGKSTLVGDILERACSEKFQDSKIPPGKHKAIYGLLNLAKVISVDQSPIGRTPRSNPCTYTGAFTYIRELFSKTTEARIRGYQMGKFSFNVKGGRCERCRGEGVRKIEMYFLPDVYVRCDECGGRRYMKEVLEITYKEKNIHQVLEMSVGEAGEFFKNIPPLAHKLKTLKEVGLGYIKLGQPATTLSGGEAQRIKLARELSKKGLGRNLYLLDEPTVGLHFEDVRRLLKVLNQLVDKGNTVLIIEHHPDVIKNADWIIDLGPEGGDEGGQVVACGTPKGVAQCKKSYTGQMLKKILGT